MQILVTETGFCWGVELAYQRIDKLAAGTEAVKATHRGGPKGFDTVRRIATDPELIRRYPALAKVQVVDDLSEVGDGETAAIGHQGLDPAKLGIARDRGVKITDHKCPFIASFDKKIELLAKSGFDLIAFGKPGNHHCEDAKAAAAAAGRVGVIAEDVAAIGECLREPNRNWACVAQVTGNTEIWNKFRRDLERVGVPVKIVDTICTDTYERQQEAETLAAKADLVVVVDDTGGASTSVFEVVQRVNANCLRHKPDAALPIERLRDAKTIAVVCGILVPKWTVDRVVDDIRRACA
jgi:4-hydroxy-3-methylbut-2-enyl diphosphate reductase